MAPPRPMFALGDFINALVSFMLVAAAVYFFVVLPVNALLARMHRSDTPADPTTKRCPECLSESPASYEFLRSRHRDFIAMEVL